MEYEDVTVSLPPDPDQVVEIWTDGGCRPNPGPGGWAAILVFRGVERELSGFDPETTNNRMELTAAAEGLEALKRPCHVLLHTDSEYLKNGITRWHQGWVRKNWRTVNGDPVRNMDLWQRVLEAGKVHEIEWRWVRSHVGIKLNERADKLATKAREEGLVAWQAENQKGKGRRRAREAPDA
ncbi:MAG: ribonuclease HI [Acetobacteraceae bacterium]